MIGSMSICMLSPSQANIAKFISDHSHLTMLENHCTTINDLKKIHAHLIKTGLSKDIIAISRVLAFSATSPVADIHYAHSIFRRIQDPNLFTWNTIIRGFSQSSVPKNAISLFIDMLMDSRVEPHRLTYPSLFKVYAHLGLADYGTQLHGRIVKLGLEVDTFIRNAIIYMYSNSGFLSEAYKLFNEDENFDVVAWNSMIIGLAKSGEIDESRRLFDKMGSRRNDISWNSMISGCVRNGRLMEAMELFNQMHEEGSKVSEFTMVSLLNACANLGSLEQGEWIYQYISKSKFELNTIMVTAIVDMYCKCGEIDKARHVFKTSPNKGLSSWNSMILGLANNGCEEEALDLFSKLVWNNIEPNEVTFLGLLTACKYMGDVNKGKDYFRLMTREYNIEPSIKHYNCMVDILGQAGFLSEASDLIEHMPVKPDAVIWGSLLSASKRHGNIEMAKFAAKHINEANCDDSSGYILLSNTYAASGHFQDAIDVRVRMKEKQVSKERGGSSIEVNGQVQEFAASSGTMNPEMQELMLLLHCYCKYDEFHSEVEI